MLIVLQIIVSIIPVAARTAQNAVVSILFHVSKSKVIADMHLDLEKGGGGVALISYMGMCCCEGYGLKEAMSGMGYRNKIVLV